LGQAIIRFIQIKFKNNVEQLPSFIPGYLDVQYDSGVYNCFVLPADGDRRGKWASYRCSMEMGTCLVCIVIMGQQKTNGAKSEWVCLAAFGFNSPAGSFAGNFFDCIGQQQFALAVIY
jgi:hypothetical protein